METFNALIKEEEEKFFLCFLLGDEELKIPLTEDNPQAVKDVFNKLIIRLKDGLFKIEMKNAGEDLFSQVAKEYVKQLNSELVSVYKELDHYNLLKEPEKENDDKPLAVGDFL